MEPSALLSHPLALASKLMSSLQHYTVQTLIPSQPPLASHHSTALPVYSLYALLDLLSKPALNHTSAHDVADDVEERGWRRVKREMLGGGKGKGMSRILVTIIRMRARTLTGFRRNYERIIRINYYTVRGYKGLSLVIRLINKFIVLQLTNATIIRDYIANVTGLDTILGVM